MSQPALFQRLEGSLALATSLWLYHLGHGNWWLFALLILFPDIAILGYLKGPRVGALIYNLGHSYLIPGTIALGYLIATNQIPNLLLIWFAHIGLDRLASYGLKKSTGFHDTHLGIIGRR
jgi:hypothetical protein